MFSDRKRLREMEDDLSTLRRKVSDMELQLADALDRMKRYVWRVERSERRAEERGDPAAPPADDGLDPVSRAIIAQRNRGRGGSQ
jgi:hypothetical protein